MNAKIKLISRQYGELELELKKEHSNYSGQEPFEIVYQDEKYNFEIQIDNSNDEIVDISLFINNNIIDVEVEKQGNLYYLQCSRCVFYLLYGITDIMVKIDYLYKEPTFLFSGYLAIAVSKKYEDTMNSIREMLDDIYKKEHYLLYKAKKRNVNENLSKMVVSKDDKYERQIELLRHIVRTYKENVPYFMRNAQYISKQSYRVDSVEKLRDLNNKSISYIATHPELLKKTQGFSGIVINKQSYVPEKTLVDIKEYNYDTFENRIVLSFLDMLIKYIEKMKKKIKNALDNNTLVKKAKRNVDDRYILSSTIIQQYVKISFEEYNKQLSEIQVQITNLFYQYKDILNCNVENIWMAPMPTPIFLGIYHYRNIFTLINTWFNEGDITIPEENTLIHFTSADLIYEYYCLLSIYDSLIELGFEENYDMRDNYKYNVNYARYSNTSEDNTFYFNKDDIQIVLYYQPVIYSQSCNSNNQISLFRTDSSYAYDSFYTPDFIIKKIHDGKVTYGILDAKWRNRSMLLKKENEGSLSDLVYKYMYSVADINTQKAVPFLWLLQGKDDFRRNSMYYHNTGKVSRTLSGSFRSASGIVQVTPRWGRNDLIKLLDTFVNHI